MATPIECNFDLSKTKAKCCCGFDEKECTYKEFGFCPKKETDD